MNISDIIQHEIVKNVTIPSFFLRIISILFFNHVI